MPTPAIPLQPLCLRHDLGDVIQERYTIREVLGAGAFGTVYRVEEVLGSRTVTQACKEMHVLNDPATVADEREEALRMFEEEAYLLQTLHNAHIPRAHLEAVKGVWLACPLCGRAFRGTRTCPTHGSDLQVVKERYYLLMDFIEGPDLEARLLANGGRPLEESAVIDWALQVCDALATVHARGFSHRDIKPANIKIEHETEQAMLIDFGLVKPSTTAGGYGTVVKGKSTGVGTIGYAPPVAHEQAHPDARTDILALGMTLYRLLTVRDPTDPGDLELMRRFTPRHFNASISPDLEAIIIKAIQVEPDQRYPDIASLQTDLKAARYPVETTCPHCGWVQRSALRPTAQTLCARCGRLLAASDKTPRNRAPRPPAAAAPAPGNPYQPRIQRIRSELAAPVTPPATPYDPRIRELESILAMLAGVTVHPLDQCPACRQARLAPVNAQPAGGCPLCQQGQLLRRQWELKHCPVCQQGELHTQHLAPATVICPICRSAPVQEDRRTRFGGMAFDLWWACPHCSAHFDVLRGNKAVLVSYGQDPFGVGAQHKGQAHTIEEWQRLSTRSELFCQCTACAAYFDQLDEEHLTLINCPSDPFGVGAHHRGHTFSRAAWARIAHDLAPASGTHHCTHCNAEFDYDRAQHTMTLIGGSAIPAWAVSWKGMAIALQCWYLAAAGKHSGYPGLLCPACHTEFDQDGALLKLVATPADNLRGSVGRSLSLDDWHRHAAGAPVASDAHQMRGELARLQAQKAEEQIQFRRNEQRRLATLEEELRGLLKQSVIGGYIPLGRVSDKTSLDDIKKLPGGMVPLPLNPIHIPLRASEALRWESSAGKCSVGPSRGAYQWIRDGEGMLVVTSERVLFVSPPAGNKANQLWQCLLAHVIGVQTDVVQGASATALTLVVLQITGAKPIAFDCGIQKWALVLDGDTYTVTVAPEDLVNVLKTLANL